MPNENRETLKNLLRVLSDQAEELLIKNQVYDVSAYGWADADMPDGEYIGIAMWEMNPPFEHDLGTLLEGRTPEYVPTERDETLLQSGEDLIATMIFARRSLGMALCFAAVSDSDLIGGNDEFWQEYATTLMWLNIASDRLRDFFLMARFGQTKEALREASSPGAHSRVAMLQFPEDSVRKQERFSLTQCRRNFEWISSARPA